MAAMEAYLAKQPAAVLYYPGCLMDAILDAVDEVVERDHDERALANAAESAFFALLPLLPLNGSVEAGYSISDRIDPTVRALPEEWASAAQAMLELHNLTEGRDDG